MKTLIIAEKQSVGNAIAAALGITNKSSGYLSNNRYVVSWCRGHLVEHCDPDAYDPTLHKWAVDAIPIVPDRWKTKVLPSGTRQFRILKKIMSDKDIQDIICATDAGREGELIFRLVYQQCGCKKTVHRMWINSMEETAILSGMKHLKPMRDYDNLYQAALCRTKADWLIGINLTRLFSLKYGATMHVGRVQSPTVNLIVQRQKEIEHFVPSTYHLLTADCGSFSVQCKTETAEDVQKILSDCTGKPVHILDVAACRRAEKPPALYNLTDVQRDANRQFGYSAKQTLDIVQSLYEHKLCTYPRTDSRYLPYDMADAAATLLHRLLDIPALYPAEFQHTTPLCIDALICDAKVSDHHALLPTMSVNAEIFSELPQTEQNILRLILYRLILAASVQYTYFTHEIKAECSGVSLSSKIKTVENTGWKKLQYDLFPDLKKDSASAFTLPLKNDTYAVVNWDDAEKLTTPPAAYTEDTLLEAMEHAGKLISDPALRTAIKSCGLGTPATRAGIIENIIHTGYIQRHGKKLLPTEKAMHFMEQLDPRVSSPEMTARWEQTLSMIEQGNANPDEFLSGIVSYLHEVKRTVFPKKEDSHS